MDKRAFISWFLNPCKAKCGLVKVQSLVLQGSFAYLRWSVSHVEWADFDLELRSGWPLVMRKFVLGEVISHSD